MTLPCITLLQPWAGLVARNLKWVETRGRPYPWRNAIGQFVGIHAAARPMRDARDCNGAGGCICAGPDGFGPIVGPFEISEVCDVHGADVALGELVATALLADVVPMLELLDAMLGSEAHAPSVAVDEFLTLYDKAGSGRAINDQRPFGDFAPGRWALILDKIATPAERCPACLPDENGMVQVDPTHRVPLRYVTEAEACPVCFGEGVVSTPIRPGGFHQGLWRWNPELAS